MASLLNTLEAEHEKDGLFTEVDTGVSYPMGFPILDQQLGFKQIIQMKDGTEYTQYRLGLIGGTINQFVGPSSSGKTAAAIQASYNITEPFGDDSGVVLCDAEASTEPQRILDLLGISEEEYMSRFRIIDDPLKMTFDGILKITKEIAEKKKSERDRYWYNTGFKDIHGEDVWYYKPTVIIIDSLMRIVPDANDLEEIPGLTSGGRDAIFRGKWLRNMLGYCRPYNIIVLVINHLGNDIQLQPGKGGPKQLTFIPTGKNIPGGEKNIYYNSAIIVWQPINAKDQIKTEEINGYNGVSVKAAVAKSRSGPGGVTATLEFIQESGFDIVLTLVQFAKEQGLIGGRNPGSYFVNNPDVKFDTRIFTKELQERPELVHALMEACRIPLMQMVRTVASADEQKMESKKNSRQMLRDMFK